MVQHADIDHTGLPGVGGSGVLNNFAATAPPAVTDDDGDGYDFGSMWVDTTDPTQAWICVDPSTGAAVWLPFPSAGGVPYATFTSGGTTSTADGYDYRAFTADGTLVVATAGLADLLLVGGGGGGGGYFSGGGGGGGQVKEMTNVWLPAASHAVQVGDGGAGGSSSSAGQDNFGVNGEWTGIAALGYVAIGGGGR